MKTILTSLILVATAVQVYALKPSYVITTNNADRLGLTVSIRIDDSTGTVSRVSVGIKSKKSISKHEATLIIRSGRNIVANIPLRHLAWRTDGQWITEFQLQTILVPDVSIILDSILGKEPRYEFNLKDWKESPNKSVDHISGSQ